MSHKENVDSRAGVTTRIVVAG